ncbi:hypothetical protein DL240_02885 [Lujinxingia litoralis]|uniref:Uncharacterized protein n=1 Tax=Lujinxingia litoralis TaxID=2211119 RepID=A0A328CE81_9DELT|nr:hypothetical protein [Lujinxingia litoralis]RAL25173.1 hypothetical protein DL240_02885 [Lujinxingia litoralis]
MPWGANVERAVAEVVSLGALASVVALATVVDALIELTVTVVDVAIRVRGGWRASSVADEQA